LDPAWHWKRGGRDILVLVPPSQINIADPSKLCSLFHWPAEQVGPLLEQMRP
jgi:hypothetical protein